MSATKAPELTVVSNSSGDLGYTYTDWSPEADDSGGTWGEEATIDPHTNVTWTTSLWTTQFGRDGLGDYTLEISATGEWQFSDGDIREDVGYFNLAPAYYPVSIVTPVRALAPHWETYCDLMKRLYAAQAAAGAARQANIDCLSGRPEGDPICPDIYTAPEYYDEMQRLARVADELEAERLSYIDEGEMYDRRFLGYPDQEACTCWCAYRPEIVCTTIPWGTTTELETVIEN